MAKISKRMKKIHSVVDTNRIYSLEEAVKLIKSLQSVKFDESIDLAFNLNIDPRKAEQNVRGVVPMPHGTGKKVRVAVFAKGPKAEEAQKAGADLVGAEDLIEDVQKGDIQFDVCVATPDMMGLLGRVAKILGPKGLMPNPKLGTVTLDVASAVKAAKSGQVEFRANKEGVIHGSVCKKSFSDEAILDNVRAYADAILKAKPTGVKGHYLRSAWLKSTMSSSVRVDMGKF